MKRRSAHVAVASIILALVSAVSVHAADKKKAKKTSEPVVNIIAAIDGNTIDITTGTATRSLKITQFTEVRLNGQKASAADLKPGMIVTDVALGADPTVASRLNASGSAAAAVETPAPEKKKKKKKASEE